MGHYQPPKMAISSHPNRMTSLFIDVNMQGYRARTDPTLCRFSILPYSPLWESKRVSKAKVRGRHLWGIHRLRGRVTGNLPTCSKELDRILLSHLKLGPEPSLQGSQSISDPCSPDRPTTWGQEKNGKDFYKRLHQELIFTCSVNHNCQTDNHWAVTEPHTRSRSSSFLPSIGKHRWCHH